ncbi:MAG: hypothetical protein BKP49_08810 [Treponema sp. CETP13]|nr:MAG: hypothetical protein BKP49_08810 [Treponema sp. CETP13]
MVKLPLEFFEFIKQSCNRFEFLQKWLQKMDIPFSVVRIGDLNHIFVQFPSSHHSPVFYTKTVIVHYDRALLKTSNPKEYNPGANDNSAAVYQTLLWINRLIHGSIDKKNDTIKTKNTLPYNVRVIFSDGEEHAGKEAGSFGLAEYFLKNKMAGKNATIKNDIYVLDGCGRGEVLTVSTAGKFQKASRYFSTQYSTLFEKCCNLARKASSESWVTLPVPYGDNAGFIANGIPAIMITMLPKEESTLYMRQLQKDRKFSEAVMNHSIIMHGGGVSAEGLKKLRSNGTDPAKALLLSEKLPKTWRMMHTQFDTADMLSEEAFSVMERFLDILALSFMPV